MKILENGKVAIKRLNNENDEESMPYLQERKREKEKEGGSGREQMCIHLYVNIF